jgi:hypothetical protein
MAMQDRRLTPEAKAIYSYFCSFAGAGTTAFPSRDKIVYDLQIGVKRYYNHFNLLKEYGYIEVKQNVDNTGQFKNNIYTLVEMIPYTQNDHTEPCSRFAYTGDAYTDNDHTIINSIKNNNIKNNTQKVLSRLVLSGTPKLTEKTTRQDETSNETSNTGEGISKKEKSPNNTKKQHEDSQNNETSKKVKMPFEITHPDQGKGINKGISTYRQGHYTAYQKYIQEQIDYAGLITNTRESGFIDNIVSVMVDVMITESDEMVKIGKEYKPFPVVKGVIIKLTRDHIELVMKKYREQPKEIFYKKAYLRTMLYNVYNEMDAHYENQIRVDYSRSGDYTYVPHNLDEEEHENR